LFVTDADLQEMPADPAEEHNTRRAREPVRSHVMDIRSFR
jgi:hypothetical protein